MDNDSASGWQDRTLDDDKPIRDTPETSLYLLVIHGEETGRRFRLKPGDEITIGRSEDALIVLHDNRVSSLHCTVTREPGGVTVEDHNSRNGTFIDGERVDRTPLRLGAQLRIGRTVMRLEMKSDEEIAREEELFKAATTDPLTRIPNRRWFTERALEEIEFCRRHNRALCVMMLDVDHFKKINDSHGHQVGDLVLSTLAGVLHEQKRAEDLLCRFGGEEFILLLRETTLDKAVIFCERLRVVVETHPFCWGELKVPVTVSIGVSALIPESTLEQLIQKADEALYSAKQQGRNRVAQGT
jgi:two-component system cell cycle response regulator